MQYTAKEDDSVHDWLTDVYEAMLGDRTSWRSYVSRLDSVSLRLLGLMIQFEIRHAFGIKKEEIKHSEWQLPKLTLKERIEIAHNIGLWVRATFFTAMDGVSYLDAVFWNPLNCDKIKKIPNIEGTAVYPKPPFRPHSVCPQCHPRSSVRERIDGFKRLISRNGHIYSVIGYEGATAKRQQDDLNSLCDWWYRPLEFYDGRLVRYPFLYTMRWVEHKNFIPHHDRLGYLVTAGAIDHSPTPRKLD